MAKPEYANSQISRLIDEHIHNRRDRIILKAHFIDGLSPDKIAKLPDVDIDVRQISRNISRDWKRLESLITVENQRQPKILNLLIFQPK